MNTSDTHGPFLPWHSVPPSAIPAVTFGIDSPKIDVISVHSDRVQRDKVFGSFCGEPIVGLDDLSIEVDEARYLQSRVDSSSGQSIPAEVLPGEEICSDGIIRRSTTAEAIGYDVYHNQEAIEANAERISIAAAREASRNGRLILWRPNRDVNPATEFALVED